MAGKAGFTTVGSMIVRHILRWPGRALMTLTGVALSLGLLFTTIQFIDATNAMLDTYFFRTQHEDISVALSESRQLSVVHDMMRQPGVLYVEPQRAVPVRLTHGQFEERAAIESTSNADRLSERIDSDGAPVYVPPGGLVLTKVLADKLEVRAGEVVHVEMLQGKRVQADMVVTRVIDEYIGTRAYMDYDALSHFAGQGPLADGLLIKADMSQSDALFAALKDMPMVAGVSRRERALEQFSELVDRNLFTMLFFYIAFASIIVIGVIYNSARITLSERSREFATLRVLGFRGEEVALILVGEMAALIAAALPVGCVIGNLLARLVSALFSSDLFRLPFAPEPRTYGFSVAVILLAAAATAIYVSIRVRHLDLIGVLKARD
jgi:putative ABC transport system permease protein